MHLALSRNTHWLTHLGVDPTHPNPGFVKVPGSSLVLTTDITLSRVQLLDMQDYNYDLTQEVAGYKKADLIVSSAVVCTPTVDSPQAIGGIAVSTNGHIVYVLVLTCPTAYIAVLQLRNRTLTRLPVYYSVPVDQSPILFVDRGEALNFEAVLHRFGQIAPVNNYLTGTGIVYYHGNLHVLTNREITLKNYHTIEETVLIRRASIIGSPEQVKKYGDWQKRGLKMPPATVIEPILLDTDIDTSTLYPLYLNIPSRYGGSRKLYKKRSYTLVLEVEGGEEDSLFVVTLGSAKSNELHVYKNSPKHLVTYSGQKMTKTDTAIIEIIQLKGNAKVTHAKVILSPGIIFDGHFAYHLTMLEELRADIQFSLLTTLQANTGELIATSYLPIPDLFTDPNTKKSIYHGLAAYDNELYILRREDCYRPVRPPKDWWLSRGTYFCGLDLEGGLDEDLHYPVGFLHWNYGATPDAQPVQDTVQDKNADGFFDYMHDTPFLLTNYTYLFKTTDAAEAYHTIETVLSHRESSEARMQVNQLVEDSTGECDLVKVGLPQNALAKVVHPIRVTKDFPFGAVTPFCITADEADRKFYALLGDHVWSFDALDFTMCVNHGGSITEGDIIDFDDVLDAGPVELQCFIRNDATFPLYNIIISFVQDVAHPRWSDGFLRLPGTTEGSKSINLGNIAPGQSKEFIVRLYCLDVKHYEEHRVYRLPLRVTYIPEI